MKGHNISVISDEFGTLDFERVAKYLHEVNLRYVELRFVWIKNVGYFDDMDIQEVKEILKENELKVSCISSGLLKTKWWGTNDSPRLMGDGTWIKDEQIKLAKNCIKIASELDCDYIRAFGFRKSDDPSEDVWNTWINAVNSISEMANQKGKMVVIENEHGCIISDLNSIFNGFKRIRAKNCKLLLDPGNLFAAGDILTKEIMEKLANITGYIHVKDARHKENGKGREWTLIGEGEVGWKEITRYFVRKIPRLFWSVETHFGDKHSKWNHTVKNIENLDTLLSTNLE